MLIDRDRMLYLHRTASLLYIFRDMLWGLVSAALLAFLTTAAILQAPYFGLRLSLPSDEGPARLQRVYDAGPASIAGVMEGADIWLFSAGDVVIDPQDLRNLRMEARLYEPSLQAGNALLAKRFATALERGAELRIVYPNEHEVVVTGRGYSPSDLRVSYWLVIILLCVINGFAFVSARFAPSPYQKVLFVTFGFTATVGGLIYLAHTEAEIVLLAFDPVQSIRANHGLSVLFAAATLLLFAARPAGLVSNRVGWSVLGASAALALLLAVTPFPVQPAISAAIMLLAAPVLVGIGVWQYRSARNQATDRAMVHVVLLCVIAGLCLAMVVAAYSGAVLADGNGAADLMSFFVVLLVAIGLFLTTAPIDLRRSQSAGQKAVSGLMAALFILVADSFLISTFALGQEVAMVLIGVSLVILFQPIRLLINRVVKRRSAEGDPRLVTRLLTESEFLTEGANATEEFAEFLAEFFSASRVEVNDRQDGPPPMPGTQLAIGHLRADEPDYVVVGRTMGTRLFSFADQDLVAEARSVAETLLGLQRKAQTAELEERDRIARDLHDLVGNKLLSLKITSGDADVRARAGDALSSLQDAVMGLDGDASPPRGDERSVLLTTLLDAFPPHLKPVVETDGLLRTSVSPWGGERLRAAQRILQEAASNAIKYGVEGSVRALLKRTDDAILLTIENQIARPNQASRPPGTNKGLHNIARRAAEIGGDAQWETGESRFVLRVRLPSEDSKAP